MTRCFLVPSDEPDPKRVAALMGPEDIVLALGLKAMLKFGDQCPRVFGLNDLIHHDRVCDLAMEAQSVLRQFISASCRGERIDRVYWPEIFDDDQQSLYFRDLLFAEEVAGALEHRGFEQVVWLGETNIKPHIPLHAFWEGLRATLGKNLTVLPRPQGTETRSLQGLALMIQSKLSRLRERSVREDTVDRKCQYVAVFATSEWERFTDPLLDLHRSYGDRFQIWYLGRIPERLRSWAAENELTVLSIPYPRSVDSDLAFFFAEKWKLWQDGGKARLAEATGHPVIAAEGLQAHFHQFFTYTLPRTVQWARSLEHCLHRAEPTLVIGSAAFTYMTAFPYHVARRLGIPSLALSHTYVSGDGTPLPSDYLACRNRFERIGFKRSFPMEGRVVYCQNSSNRISYVATERPALKNGNRPVVVVLTALSTLDGVVTPDVDIKTFWATMNAIIEPPPEFSDLHFVIKSHPRFDITPLLDGRISRDNVEIFPALGSVTDLLNEAWAIVICNHYGGVVADSMAGGVPLLFLNPARFFYPNFDPMGEQAGESIAGMAAFWETLDRLKRSPDFYAELVARCESFRAQYIEVDNHRLSDRLVELAHASEAARRPQLSVATP